MAIDELDDDLCPYLGPDRTGSLLEVITLFREGDHDELAIQPRRCDRSTADSCPGVTMAEDDHGRTRSGSPIDDELVDRLSERAEEGFEVDEILRGRTNSELIREARRRYLRGS